MTKKSDTPAIRFKGFTDTWEQRKLGDNIIEYTETTTKNNQYPPLTSSRKGIFLQTEYFAGNQIASDDNTGYNIVPYGYFTYRHMSDDEIFHFNINDIVENGIVSTLYPVFTTDENLDSRYLQYQLNYGYEFAKFAILQKQGGSRTYMYLNKLKQLYLTMPKSVEEQNAISAFFMSLDHLITLHQRKYDKLTNVKKSMLEKMFPKNGSNVPEIRFKGFTEAWEQRKFSELYEKVSRKNDLTYGKDDIISVANMYFKEDSYITDESYLLTYNIFELGDIAFEGNKSKNYAHGRFVENTIGNGIVSHVFDVFKPIMKPYDLQFWKYAINNEQLMGGILLRSTKASTMMTNLVANDFLQETFLTPTYPEQQKIGAFFQQLDNLITLHQRELEKLKNIKKSCLENMFV